jgi:hypothetical protein
MKCPLNRVTEMGYYVQQDEASPSSLTFPGRTERIH